MDMASFRTQLQQLTQFPYSVLLGATCLMLVIFFVQHVYVSPPDSTPSEREFSLPVVKPLAKPMLSESLASWQQQAVAQITPETLATEPEGATKLENQHLRIRGTWLNSAKQAVALFEIIENNTTRFAPYTQGELFGYYKVAQIANQQVSLADTREPNAEPIVLVVFEPISNRE
ncbi:hypothetical protein GCM10010919_17240 [Alishewanella longhuensis]|uniref:Type II secretion system protein GspC N-terminal domain-containing protein n=1 Tax=Alishewanella longhuensis TaxID=1091037 RepID=A0ABQ3KXY3_9ALTE|nr:hypothetical protein [Alishewanella longhuensis]GHG68079.1 hypothetical protein GCM10010919_17240 [Alishewanella longhuensis]